MLFAELTRKAAQETIVTNESNLKSYIRPDYRHVLYLLNLTAQNVSDFPGVTDDMIAEYIKLEVQARNTNADRAPMVIDWFYEVINSTIDPAMIDQENDLFKNMMDYMKLNSELKDKQKELEQKQQKLDQKSNIKQLIPGMNFAKAKP